MKTEYIAQLFLDHGGDNVIAVARRGDTVVLDGAWTREQLIDIARCIVGEVGEE